MDGGIMPLNLYELGGGGMHSKHNILCGTVHEYFENKKKICNGHQYEMQKSWNGVWNNAYKIFSSWVEEGNISNTISYVKLFMTHESEE